MKRKTIQKTLLLLAIILISAAAKAQDVNKFLGAWDFKAPTAGYGWDFGVMVIEKASVVTTFTGNSAIYPSDWVKYESDTLRFNFYVEDEYCKCYSVLEDDANQKGYCSWPSGESAIILTRKQVNE